MNEYQLLLKTLNRFNNIPWLTQYFDLLKKLLTELSLEDSDPRLALSLRKDNTMPVNIGQRYVLKPLFGEKAGCIVPMSFAEEAVNATATWYFSHQTIRDAKWIILPYPTGAEFPAVLYQYIVGESESILKKAKKSGYRRYHNSLLYHFTMEPAVRQEVLTELTTFKC